MTQSNRLQLDKQHAEDPKPIFCRFVQDVPLQKQANGQANGQALYAGLPDQNHFAKMLERVNKRAQRNQARFALLYLSIEYLRTDNKHVETTVADKFVKTAIRELQRSLRVYDYMAHLEDNKFAIILDDIKEPHNAGQIAQKLIDALAGPHKIEQQLVQIDVSVGIACYPEAGSPSGLLAKHADIALCKAINAGYNQYCFFMPEVNQAHLRRLQLENELRLAIAKREFYVVYQPQYDLNTHKVIALEALLRWQHPEFGLIDPNEFIPLADAINENMRLDHWVMQQSCHDYAKHLQICSSLKLAINLSLKHLCMPNNVSCILAHFERAQVPCQRIEFEVSASDIKGSTTELNAILQRLRQEGFSIALEHFGSGDFSLNHLKNLNINTLKLDHALLCHLDNNSQDSLLTSSIIELAQNLDINVVATGVETTQQLQFLRAHACSRAQGSLLADPMPLAQLLQWLKSSRLG